MFVCISVMSALHQYMPLMHKNNNEKHDVGVESAAIIVVH